MDLRLSATALRMPFDEGGRPFPPPPSTELHPSECIHARLVAHVGDHAIPLQRRRPDDACLRDWVVLLSRASDDLVAPPDDDAEWARHPTDESVFTHRGSRAYLHGVAVERGALHAAIETFFVELRSEIIRSHPGGERWWADLVERGRYRGRLWPGL